jgi:hypothetical protein
LRAATALGTGHAAPRLLLLPPPPALALVVLAALAPARLQRLLRWLRHAGAAAATRGHLQAGADSAATHATR